MQETSQKIHLHKSDWVFERSNYCHGVSEILGKPNRAAWRLAVTTNSVIYQMIDILLEEVIHLNAELSKAEAEKAKQELTEAQTGFYDGYEAGLNEGVEQAKQGILDFLDLKTQNFTSPDSRALLFYARDMVRREFSLECKVTYPQIKQKDERAEEENI